MYRSRASGLAIAPPPSEFVGRNSIFEGLTTYKLCITHTKNKSGNICPTCIINVRCRQAGPAHGKPVPRAIRFAKEVTESSIRVKVCRTVLRGAKISPKGIQCALHGYGTHLQINILATFLYSQQKCSMCTCRLCLQKPPFSLSSLQATRTSVSTRNICQSRRKKICAV